ncbi:MAG: hypothetical protein ACJASQ_001197 [Crocinitomicaceae bacterium]|jgi:hypothetical protein
MLELIIQKLKYIWLFIIIVLFGISAAHGNPEFTFPPHCLHFTIETPQNESTLEKAVQPNVGFLKEKQNPQTMTEFDAQITQTIDIAWPRN